MSSIAPIVQDESELHEDIASRILRHLKDNFSKYQFRGFYDGDPLLIPRSSLPAVVVETSQSNNLIGPTGHDKWQENIIIKLVVDKTDEMGANSDVVISYKRLKQMVFARDKTTKEFLPNSLMAILRKNFTLDDVVIQQNVTVDYGLAERGDELLTAEVHISFTAQQIVEIGQRS